MLKVEPDQNYIISTERILSLIDQHADELALILLPGIQYYSGQLLDIPTITAHAHSRGVIIGWDLAHAAGNVELKLHDWDVDFACWCTYKYMNCGAGAIGGAFVHEKHGDSTKNKALKGWYGHEKSSRFLMDNSEYRFAMICAEPSKLIKPQSSDPRQEHRASSCQTRPS